MRSLGTSGSSKRGCREQSCVRGECEGKGSGLRLRRGDLVPPKPSRAASDAARDGSGGNFVRPDAAGDSLCARTKDRNRRRRRPRRQALHVAAQWFLSWCKSVHEFFLPWYQCSAGASQERVSLGIKKKSFISKYSSLKWPYFCDVPMFLFVCVCICTFSFH